MIRWPQDALTFSRQVGPYACYAAGYVEGAGVDELLAGGPGANGTELVLLRSVRIQAPSQVPYLVAVLERQQALAALPGFVPIRDVLLVRGPLQNELEPDVVRVVVVEALPGNVHAGDLRVELQRAGTPPPGIALAVARPLLAAIRASLPPPPQPVMPPLVLRAAAPEVLVGWDGTVHVQVRVEPAAATPVEANHARAAAGLVLDLLAGFDAGGRRRPLASVQPALAPRFVRVMRDAFDGGRVSLDELNGAVDEAAADHPCSPADLAGVLAQLFPDERAQDLVFREDLAAGSIEAFGLARAETWPFSVEKVNELLAG